MAEIYLDLDGHRLTIGCRLPMNAYDSNGEMLLGAGNLIDTNHQLIRLSMPDVQFGVYFKEIRRQSCDEPVEKVPAIQQDIAHAAGIKAAVVNDMHSVFTRLESSGDIDLGLIHNAASKLQQEMQRNFYAISSLAMLKDADAYTFTHSVNVGIIAMYLTMGTKYADSVEDIGVGALMHDIGKLDISPSILRKEGPLDFSEMNTMKRHPTRGAQILHAAGCQNKIVLSCVLEHHEKLTGRGYPYRKAGDAVSPYGRIMAISDVYDALTTDRPYRKAMAPRDAITIMTNNMSRDLDIDLLRQFLNAIGKLAEFEAESGICPNSEEWEAPISAEFGESITGLNMLA